MNAEQGAIGTKCSGRINGSFIVPIQIQIHCRPACLSVCLRTAKLKRQCTDDFGKGEKGKKGKKGKVGMGYLTGLSYSEQLVFERHVGLGL